MKHIFIKAIFSLSTLFATCMGATTAYATSWDERFSGTYNTQCQNGSYAAMFSLDVNGMPLAKFPLSIPAQCEAGIGLAPSDEWIDRTIVGPLVALCDTLSERLSSEKKDALSNFLESCAENADYLGRQFQLSINQLSPQPWNGFYTDWNGLSWNWFGKRIYSKLPATDTIEVLEDGGLTNQQFMVLDWAHTKKSTGGLNFKVGQNTTKLLGADVTCSSTISGITTQHFDEAHTDTLVTVRTNHLAMGNCLVVAPSKYQALGLTSAKFSVSAATETQMRGERISQEKVLDSLKLQIEDAF